MTDDTKERKPPVTTPPVLAALRLIEVHDDRPGSLTGLLARLQRAWRKGEAEREQLNQRRNVRGAQHG